MQPRKTFQQRRTSRSVDPRGVVEPRAARCRASASLCAVATSRCRAVTSSTNLVPVKGGGGSKTPGKMLLHHTSCLHVDLYADLYTSYLHGYSTRAQPHCRSLNEAPGDWASAHAHSAPAPHAQHIAAQHSSVSTPTSTIGTPAWTANTAGSQHPPLGP